MPYADAYAHVLIFIIRHTQAPSILCIGFETRAFQKLENGVLNVCICMYLYMLLSKLKSCWTINRRAKCKDYVSEINFI